MLMHSANVNQCLLLSTLHAKIYWVYIYTVLLPNESVILEVWALAFNSWAISPVLVLYFTIISIYKMYDLYIYTI